MHTTADDPTKYRSEDEVRAWEAKEPLPRFRRYLEQKGLLDEPAHAALEAEVDAQIRESIERQVRREFLLEAIARQETLEVTDPEVGEEMSQLLQAGGRIAQEFRQLPAERRRERTRQVPLRRAFEHALRQLEHANRLTGRLVQVMNMQGPVRRRGRRVRLSGTDDRSHGVSPKKGGAEAASAYTKLSRSRAEILTGIRLCISRWRAAPILL